MTLPPILLRPVKELPLAGIVALEMPNGVLDGKYLPALNLRFGPAATGPVDLHRAATRHLDEVLSWEAERVVQVDWTVACEGKR